MERITIHGRRDARLRACGSRRPSSYFAQYIINLYCKLFAAWYNIIKQGLLPRKGMILGMAKSIYSLVLDDEVIALIDRMAYAEGASRSALINRILAENVGFSTPEMRMRDIFRRMEDILESSLLPMPAESGDSTLRLRSAISYKYNPTVKYTVALGREGASIGELRIQVRSRSDGFTIMLLQFFRLWARLEEAYIGKTDISFEAGRLTRKLIPHKKNGSIISEAVDGSAIAAYVNAFDGAMKAFFAGVNDPAEAQEAVEARMADYVRRNDIIM